MGGGGRGAQGRLGGGAQEVGFGSDKKSRKAGVLDTESGGPPGEQVASPLNTRMGSGNPDFKGKKWPAVEPHTLHCHRPQREWAEASRPSLATDLDTQLLTSHTLALHHLQGGELCPSRAGASCTERRGSATRHLAECSNHTPPNGQVTSQACTSFLQGSPALARPSCLFCASRVTHLCNVPLRHSSLNIDLDCPVVRPTLLPCFCVTFLMVPP